MEHSQVNFDIVQSKSLGLCKDGDLAGAIAVWDEQVELYPNAAMAYFARGSLRVLTPHWRDDGIGDFFTATTLQPQNFDLAIKIGSICEQVGDFDAAVKFYGMGISISPKNNIGYWYRGLAYCHNEFPRLAAEDFTSAISINNKDGFAYLRRAVCNIQLENIEQAFTDLQNAIQYKDTFSGQADINFLLNQTLVHFAVKFSERDLKKTLTLLAVAIPDANDDHAIVVFKILCDQIANQESRKLAHRMLDDLGRYSPEIISAIRSLAAQSGIAG